MNDNSIENYSTSSTSTLSIEDLIRNNNVSLANANALKRSLTQTYAQQWLLKTPTSSSSGGGGGTGAASLSLDRPVKKPVNQNKNSICLLDRDASIIMHLHHFDASRFRQNRNGPDLSLPRIDTPPVCSSSPHHDHQQQQSATATNQYYNTLPLSSKPQRRAASSVRFNDYVQVYSNSTLRPRSECYGSAVDDLDQAALRRKFNLSENEALYVKYYKTPPTSTTAASTSQSSPSDLQCTCVVPNVSVDSGCGLCSSTHSCSRCCCVNFQGWQLGIVK